MFFEFLELIEWMCDFEKNNQKSVDYIVNKNFWKKKDYLSMILWMNQNEIGKMETWPIVCLKLEMNCYSAKFKFALFIFGFSNMEIVEGILKVKLPLNWQTCKSRVTI